jgi:hypothetical protein
MKSIPTIISFLFFLSTNCNVIERESWTIEINSSKDSCYKLIASTNKIIFASRVLEIVENTFKDSFSLGYAVLSPGFTGDFTYLRNGDGALYTKGWPEKDWPATNELCINPYQDRVATGKLVIKYFEKADTSVQVK